MSEALNHLVDTAEAERALGLFPDSPEPPPAAPPSRGLPVTRPPELRSLHPDGQKHSSVSTAAQPAAARGALWRMKDGRAYFKVFSCLLRQQK